MTRHLFTYLRNDDMPFRRLSPFQSKFFAALEQNGFDIVSTSVLQDGTLLTTWANMTDDQKVDLDRIHARILVEQYGGEEAARRAVDDAVDHLSMDLLYNFVSDDPVPEE